MATSTFTPIATVQLTAGENTVTFSGIPSTYRDIVIKVAQNKVVSGLIWGQFNGDTGSNYEGQVFRDSPQAFTYASTSWRLSVDTQLGVEPPIQGQSTEYHVLDYANTSKYKNVVGTHLDRSDRQGGAGSIWLNTNAITSMTFFAVANPMVSVTISLYGIEA